MSRRWPCIVVIALCCLLAIATPASAECAWIMWMKTQTLIGGEPGDQTDRWTLLSAHSTQGECERSARDLAEESREELKKNATPKIQIGGKGSIVAITTTEPLVIKLFTNECWPDTIDPRGPKAGGR